MHDFHQQQIQEFIQALQACFNSQLVAVYLFGSAASDQLRPLSDVNLLVVVREFCAMAHTGLQPALRQGRALIQLHVMFVEEQELPSMASCFAIKFADIQARHRLLWGADVLKPINLKPSELINSARQMLGNFQLRSREQFLLAHSREEQLVKLIASAAAPLRANAAAIMFLRTGTWTDGKAALKLLTINNACWSQAVAGISLARETQSLPEGCAKDYFNALQEIARFLLAQLATQGGDNVCV
jgi:predicted nucleotidyltransferase